MEQQQEQQQAPKQWHGCIMVCITEDVNGGDASIDTLNGDYNTVDDAKQWINDNASGGHYSVQNYQKIIVIREGSIVQIYERKPYNYGSWTYYYDED